MSDNTKPKVEAGDTKTRICVCGHNRSEHDIEQPYQCNAGGLYATNGTAEGIDVDACECEGFTFAKVEAESVPSPQTPEPQDVLTKWAAECFGDDQVNSPEIRGLRLAEESIEFSQAVNVPAEKLHALIDYVYDRPAGQPAQELGGVAVTALVAASSIGVRFDECLATEQARVLAKPREHFAARNKAKVDAGFSGAQPPSSPADKGAREEAEKLLFNELGFSFGRVNSALQVTTFEPFKIESLIPAQRDYTAHFKMQQAWDKLVELRARVEKAEADIATAKSENDQQWADWRLLCLEIAKAFALLDAEWSDAGIAEMDEFDPWDALRKITVLMRRTETKVSAHQPIVNPHEGKIEYPDDALTRTAKSEERERVLAILKAERDCYARHFALEVTQRESDALAHKLAALEHLLTKI